MQIEHTALEGVMILTPARFEDTRGFFSESWNAQRMAKAGLGYAFVQDNHSLSLHPDTLRGLHFQAPPHGQTKLVRCGRGALYDIAVDIRKGSPTYGHWIGVDLSFENGRQLLIPEGFLHGFVTRMPETEIIYKCSAHYVPEADGVVRWDSCGIDWGLTGSPVVSDKDRNAPSMAQFDSPFTYEART